MPIDMLFKYRSLTFFHNQIRNDIHLKESLKVNHNKFTRQNQSAFKLPRVKTEMGKQSMFYFSALLYNQLVGASVITQSGRLEGYGSMPVGRGSMCGALSSAVVLHLHGWFGLLLF